MLLLVVNNFLFLMTENRDKYVKYLSAATAPTNKSINKSINQSISLIATLRSESRIANDRPMHYAVEIIDKNSKRNKQCACT